MALFIMHIIITTRPSGAIRRPCMCATPLLHHSSMAMQGVALGQGQGLPWHQSRVQCALQCKAGTAAMSMIAVPRCCDAASSRLQSWRV